MKERGSGRKRERKKERRGSARVLGEFPSSPGTSIDLPAIALSCGGRLSAVAALYVPRRHSLFLKGSRASPPGTRRSTPELLTPELDPHRNASLNLATIKSAFQSNLGETSSRDEIFDKYYARYVKDMTE